MPAPTNTTPATAIDITGALPYSNTQQVDFSGTAYTVYYKRTALDGETEFGAWFFGDLVTYKPYTEVVDENDVLIDFGEGSKIQGNPNKPIQHPAVSGTTYYYRVTPLVAGNVPANLTISLLLGANQTILAGTPFINEKLGSGYPAVFFSRTADDTAVKFIAPFAGGENAAIFRDGTALFFDLGGAAGDPAFAWLYDGQLNLLNAAVISLADARGLTCNGDGNNFFISFVSGGVGSVKAISKAGAVGATVASGISNMAWAIAVSPDETILYFVKTTGAIGRWNLTSNTVLSDLAAAVASYTTSGIGSGAEILCLSDGKIVVGYALTASPNTLLIKVYNADGTTYSTITPGGVVAIRFGTAENDPTHFVTTIDNASSGIYRDIKKLRTSDGAVEWSVKTTVFDAGVSTETAAASMIRFGRSSSCPVSVIRQAIIPPSITKNSGLYFIDPGSEKRNDTIFSSITGSPPTSFTSRKHKVKPFVIQPVDTSGV